MQRAVGLSWQVQFTRADTKTTTLINYKHSNYAGKGTLFFFCQSLMQGLFYLRETHN